MSSNVYEPHLAINREVRTNCGCTHGAHLADAYYSEFYKQAFPANYCPGHEGRMDWDKGPGTVFIGSGKYRK